MAIDVGHRSGPQRTRALVEEIAGRRGAQLRGQVAAARRGAPPDLIEEAFQEACLRAARSCRGQTLDEVYKYLLKTTDSIVDDMRDHLKREVLVDHAARQLQTADPSLAPADEVVIKREERAELVELTFAILGRLDERGRKVAVLHSHGFARKDIARHLGVTPRIVKRDVEGVLASARAQLARLVGSGCPEGHALVARHAFGLAAGREKRDAQLHLVTCQRCGAMYEGIDLWRARVAVLVPLPAAVEVSTSIVERVVQTGTDVLATGPSPESRGGMRRQIADAAAHLREHANAAYYRAIDPTPLTGVRPGAVAAAVAGCLAVGGGTTYCVQEGADPLTALSRFAAKTREETRPKQRPKRARAAQTPTPPATTPTVPPPATVQQPSPPPAKTTTEPPPLPPAPEDEFEPSSPGGSAASAQAASPSQRKPAPAPADGPGEFDGP